MAALVGRWMFACIKWLAQNGCMYFNKSRLKFWIEFVKEFRWLLFVVLPWKRFHIRSQRSTLCITSPTIDKSYLKYIFEASRKQQKTQRQREGERECVRERIVFLRSTTFSKKISYANGIQCKCKPKINVKLQIQWCEESGNNYDDDENNDELMNSPRHIYRKRRYE